MSVRYVVYHCAEAPETMRFIAYILAPGSKKGTEHRMGIAFPASTAEAALAGAEKHWQAEADRHKVREAAAAARLLGQERWRAAQREKAAPAVEDVFG